MLAAMSRNMQPAAWSSSYTQSPDRPRTPALHGLSRDRRQSRRAEKRNRPGVQNQGPGWGGAGGRALVRRP